MEDFGASRSARTFKLLTIVGCAGTLVFLGLEGWRDNFGGEWRRWQEGYARTLAPEFQATFEPGIKQAFVPELGRVDRCQSCHIGIDDPAMADAPKPVMTHPGTILASHPTESFGCTICHQGQGRALEQDAAHGRVAHWEEPLLEGELVYTSCGRCHAENALFGHEAELFAGAATGAIRVADLAREVPGAELLNRGKRLTATSGCLGCHAYQGRGGTLGPDLTHVGDKGIHGYDFSHLPVGAERTPLEWLKTHFMDPGAVSPGTVMPGIGSDERDAEALAAYMLSLKSRDVPARYRPVPKDPLRGGGGEPLGGEQLYELFCVACHGRDLAGGEVPEIRTPSLSNEDFLAVVDADYLRYLVEHGKSGTSMPAWGKAGAGLTDEQIGSLVDHVLSFTPRRADAAGVSARRGDPRMGRAIYRGNCATCHGLEGEGGLGTRLASPDFLGLASDEFLAHTLVEGRPGTGMPAWTSLTTQQVSDVLSHLRGWGHDGVQDDAVLAYLDEGVADPAMGARLFRSRCSDCHGDRGEGAIGPSLSHERFLSLVDDAYLAHSILAGRPGTAMPAWGDLAVEDVGDLIAHLRSLTDAAYVELPDPVLQGDPQNGEHLFARVCSSCHGQDAVGGMGPELRNPVFLSQATDAFLFETIAGGRYGTPMRGFLKPGIGANGERVGDAGIAELARSQVADIVAWLRGLEHAGPTEAWRHPALGSPSRGREIYEDTGSCAKCHGYEGEGGVGPALGNPWFLDRASEGFLLGTLVVGRSGTEMRKYTGAGMAQLDAEELMDVAAYVRVLGERLPEGRAGWRRYEATDDQVAVGGELFAGYCAACHGTDGTGGFAPELNNREFLFAASDGLLVATIARGRIGTPMRPFGSGPASLADLTHGEIRAIVAFLRSWESTSPDDGPAREQASTTTYEATASLEN